MSRDPRNIYYVDETVTTSDVIDVVDYVGDVDDANVDGPGWTLTVDFFLCQGFTRGQEASTRHTDF